MERIINEKHSDVNMEKILKLFNLRLIHMLFYFIIVILPLLIYLRNKFFTEAVPLHKFAEILTFLLFSLVIGLLIGSISFYLRHNWAYLIIFTLIVLALYVYYVLSVIALHDFVTNPTSNFGRWEL